MNPYAVNEEISIQSKKMRAFRPPKPAGASLLKRNCHRIISRVAQAKSANDRKINKACSSGIGTTTAT
jgi:hypothetical protein